ncbi:MAG: hypothetical protein B7Z10_12635 [Rhodobacterales bacterium 32-66-7]|nr:MAG: hypothetical protein B7Z31_07200 [Rhodobacterales bacterium 12-65-15]OYX22763.1 MAG: hypothetical protein B7Z10_12635 [Rhodobacterales bacterium 32-66-7]
MTKIIASMLAASIALSATSAFAGGPVIIEDTTEVVAEKPASSIGVLPLLIGAIVIGAVLLNNNDDEEEGRIFIEPDPITQVQ